MAEDILQKVAQIISSKLGIDIAQITPTSSFTGDLGADSLDLVELVLELEKEFGVSIPDSEVEKLRTVGDVVEYIKNPKPKK